MKAERIIRSLLAASIVLPSCLNENGRYLVISREEYLDRMKAAWVGQMAGVGWGQPTEFDYISEMIPAEEVPVWNNNMVNQQGNDDLYVEMTFLASMDKHGLGVSIRQAGIDFANTGYTLWAANNEGRENLRYGIAPPESSHPRFNDHCDDIDYQIEADYSGIISPGMPNAAIRLGEKFGRLMNYGDGLYGGLFVGSMYSLAYFEDDQEKIITGGLKSIPGESHYATCIRDVLRWHEQFPDDWKRTWNLIEDKYHHSTEYQKFAEQKNAWIPIDAKLNGAYIVMGLLYGKGDMDSTIVISMRGGKDSDCNPSNAGGILATTIGFENLPARFKEGLDTTRRFSYSEYNFTDLLEVCEDLARQNIEDSGGKIAKDRNGKEYFYIPHSIPEPPLFTPSYDPGPCDPGNRYTDSEMSDINCYSVHHFEPVTEELGFPMEISNCGKSVVPGIIGWNHRERVISTSPVNRERGVKIQVSVEISNQDAAGGVFRFSAGHEPDQQWRLRVRKDGKTVEDILVNAENSSNGWMDFSIDLGDPDGRENMNITLLADQLDESPVVNYWSDFRTIME
jgi:hypothetical protein